VLDSQPGMALMLHMWDNIKVVEFNSLMGQGWADGVNPNVFKSQNQRIQIFLESRRMRESHSFLESQSA
jgi:hypothetical protein